MESLRNKVVVITGANQGIGKGLAIRLGQLGCRLAICARNEEKLSQVVTELTQQNVVVLAKRVDVSQENEVDQFFLEIEQRFGQIDVLVNNAGAFDGGRLDELTLSAWNNVIDSCLTGSFLCSRAAFRRMKIQRRGRILNIGSISAQRPREGNTPYAAAKFGVWGLTQAIALDGRPFGISCSCLHPGNVMVERRAKTGRSSDSEPMMEVDTIVDAAVTMLSVPDHVNFLEAIVLPVDQDYLGRG